MLRIPIAYKKNGGRYPGIVLCHGPGGARHPDIMNKDLTMIRASRWLAEVGYVVLRFYYQGVGESEGPEFRLIPYEQVEDIRNAITFLQQQRVVEADRIGLLGLATGGSHVIYTAGIDTRARCVVSVNGIGDLGRWLQSMRRYWEWLEFLKTLDEDRLARVLTGKSRCLKFGDIVMHDPEIQEIANRREREMPFENLLSLESAEAFINYRPETVVDKISPRAAMWICVKDDTLVPNDESWRMFQKAGQPKKLVFLDGKSHYTLYGSGLERVMSQAIEWFNAHL
jgi:pimeloyl-ACP methyl ester carboxylesterase